MNHDTTVDGVECEQNSLTTAVCAASDFLRENVHFDPEGMRQPQVNRSTDTELTKLGPGQESVIWRLAGMSPSLHVFKRCDFLSINLRNVFNRFIYFFTFNLYVTIKDGVTAAQ